MELGLCSRRSKYAKHLRDAQYALEGTHASQAHVPANAATALETCCVKVTGAHVHKGQPGKGRLPRAWCRHRICPYCHAMRSASVADALFDLAQAEIAAGKKLGIFTLTIQHTLRDELRWLRNTISKAWSLMTQRALWKCFVENYHRVAEVERTRAGGWHPHFHVLTSYLFDPKRYRAMLDAGTLVLDDQFLTWERWMRARDKADAKRLGVKWCKRTWDAGRDARLQEFGKATVSDFERWFALEWADCTAKAGRKGQNIRFRAIKPSREPGKVLQRWKDKDGRWKERKRDLQKVLRELTKYTTKGTGKGGKGKVGFLDYTPDEVAEYLRAIKSWRLHQSSRAWSKAERAAETDDLERAVADFERDGGTVVSWGWLVAGARETIAGRICKSRPLQTHDPNEFKDWLWIAELTVALFEQEACEFSVDTNQYEALKSHVEYVKGERLSYEVVPFKLSIPEEREVWRAKGIEGWSPQVKAIDWDDLRLQAALDYADAPG